jgi:transcriptional regulator with XRE-family HTH domain/sRNA-binding regulator protein Hfq
MAENLWKLRQVKGLTLAQLSARSGVPFKLLNEYETGKPLSHADLIKLSKALYVAADALKLQSDPRPAKPNPAAAKTEASRAAPAPKPTPPPAAVVASPLAAPPAAPSPAAPLAAPEPNPAQAGETPPATTAAAPAAKVRGKRRAILPEGVDQFENEYLARAQSDGAKLEVKLFNGEMKIGSLAGFDPYTLLLRLDDGSELTLQKLAIAYYRRPGGDA